MRSYIRLRAALLVALLCAVAACGTSVPAPPAHKMGAARPTSGEHSLEEYGAKGDGVTSDATPMTGVIAALASGGTLRLGCNKTYLIGGPFTVPANVSIVGCGVGSSILKNTGNTSTLVIGGQNVHLRDFSILGNSTGAAQVGVQNGTVGAHASTGASKFFATNVAINSMGGDAWIMADCDSILYGPTLVGAVADAPGGSGAGAGFHIDACEYLTCTNCVAKNAGAGGGSPIGVLSAAGNMTWAGGNITNNGVGVYMKTSADGLYSNYAHGTFVGVTINHNGGAIYTAAGAVPSGSGESFVGCQIHFGDIWLISSYGVLFSGNTIDVGDLIFQGSLGTQFVGNAWPDSVANALVPDYLSTTSTEFWSQNRKLDGTAFVGGYVSITPANGANALTYAQSNAEYLDLLAGATLAVTLTSAVGPNATRRIWIKNETSQTVTYGWASGTTVTIATATSALIGADGTNAIKLMSGT